MLRIYGFMASEIKYGGVLYKIRKNKTEEGTVMVFRLDNDMVAMQLCVYRIGMVGKQVNVLFGSSAKKQQDGQPTRNHYV